MQIALYNDFIIQFLISNSKDNKDKKDILRYNIFYNPNNTFTISQKYFDLIAHSLENSELYDDFTEIYVKMDDDARFNSVPCSATSINIEQEFIHLNNSIGTTGFFLSITENKLSTVPQAVCISEIAKPNRHWTLSNLAAHHNAIIDNCEFNCNPEIQSIFDDILNLPKSNQSIYYFDRYAAKNIAKHTLFKAITKKGYPIEVYTYVPGKKGITQHELNKRKNKVISVFGNPCKFFFTYKKKLSHERKIMFNNLIIRVDVDFSEIKKANKTWEITIQYSPEKFKESVKKAKKFKEIV